MSKTHRPAVAEKDPPGFLVEDYLDRLMVPLVGVVPARERLRLRQEAFDHLGYLRERYLAEGFAPASAERAALDAYGSPVSVANQFLESWYRKERSGPLFQRFGRANVTAFSVFAALQFMTCVLLLLRVYLPSESVFHYAIDPAAFYRFMPNWMPLPEWTPLFSAVVLAVLFAPLIGGWIVGALVPVRSTKAVYQGLMPCIVYSFLAAIVLLPAREMLMFSVVQLFYWLPAGMMMARISSVVMRDWRMHREVVQ
jgi:hypothetical protein